MSRNPLVSVLLPVGKNKKYLREAMESVKNQSFRNFELLVEEDHGEGMTKLLIRIANKAKGEFLARMDADDVSIAHRFQVQIEYLRSHSETQLVGSWAELIDERGKSIDLRKMPTEWNGIKRNVYLRNPLIHSTWMMRRLWYERVGGYNPKYRFSQDWELLLRTVWSSRVENIPEPLLRYRVHQHSTSFSSNKAQLYYGLRAQFATLARGDVARWKALWLIPKLGSFLVPSALKFHLSHS